MYMGPVLFPTFWSLRVMVHAAAYTLEDQGHFQQLC